MCIDCGCGSGVLSIAAAKLGFGPVIALDREPEAVAAARENAVANDVEWRFGLRMRLPTHSGVRARPPNLERGLIDKLASRIESPLLVASGYLTAEWVALTGWSGFDRRDSTAEPWSSTD